MSGETLARGAGAGDDPGRVAVRLALGCGPLVVAAALTLAAVAGPPPLVYQYVPLVLSVVVLGLPHGAVDHLALPRARGDPVTPRSLALVGLLYLIVGGAYAVVWFLAPVVAFVLFILVTLVHWGQGDVYALVALAGADHLETRTRRLLTLVVRGALPMLVPLVAFPAQYAFVAETLVGSFDPGAAAALEPAFAPPVRAAVAVGVGAAVALALTLGFVGAGREDGSRGRARGPWAVDLVETLGLVAYFAVVPPILAIGLYFCFWHSLRHVLRTMLVDPVAGAALDRGAFGAACRRFARDAALPTAGGLAVFAGIWLSAPRTPGTVPDLIALYLVAIAVLTLPHVVVTTLLDREQRLWSPSA
ncbi:Brp/Blh family beta-carotene 15,15'-dioxygenase [Salinilacihabitans rarus]|uniref:Brp/Blh family beta-carotene 15,15'-dioxygenase n=1 Tax=Salinilacihabitans rarus TaxID=2961596 RepID=UPI0020C837B2|nr:Brp/Blh family beta-carotene 15,15'-dioxygenase [Salinilacihabitans rarus]